MAARTRKQSCVLFYKEDRLQSQEALLTYSVPLHISAVLIVPWFPFHEGETSCTDWRDRVKIPQREL